MHATLEQIIQRVPEWRGKPYEASLLGGGLTNQNYRVEVDGAFYVVRICGHDTELLGINRRHEYECNLIAAEAGVAPRVVAFFPDLGSLVTQYVDGVKRPASEIGTRENIERVVRSVRALHGARTFPSQWSPFRMIEGYAQTASRLGCPIPDDGEVLSADLRHIEQVLYRDAAPQAVPCHNDLLNDNFLDDGSMRIIDYEYAAMGDPYFDLANFSSHHRLTDEQDVWLLEAYARRADAADMRRLQLMKLVSDVREAMWGVVQIRLSKLNFDYEPYAREWFGRYQVKRASMNRAWLRAND